MNPTSNSLDLSPLPEPLAAEIRAALQAERQARTTAEAQAKALAEQVARLELLIKEIRRALYGRRSEKLHPDQLSLALEDLETAAAEAQAAAAPAAGRAASQGKAKEAKRNLGHLPKGLPRIEQVIEPDSLVCACGCTMVRIGEERSERLDIAPAQFRVIATIRPKYACRACSEGVRQAPAPAHLIEGGLPSEALIAHVLVAKYADHSPLYRQSQIYARSGLDLHRATLAGWVGKAAFHLRPLFERLAEHIKSSDKLFMDETRAPVLDPGRGRTKSGYLWALARDDRPWGGSDPPAVVYFYAPGRGGKYGETFLQGFSGILQVDGYAGYNRLTDAKRPGGAVKLAYCWSHARRKLYELADKPGSTIGSQGIANDGLERIAALYRIEAEIRGQSAAQRLAARQRQSAPLVEAFGIWLQQQRARLSAKAKLGEVLAYIANHWSGLQLFLSDGRIEIDSNAVENTIRPLALNRKNALFAGHDEGGTNWGIIASLIETAKLNHINPFDYLKKSLEAIAQGHPQNRIDELMPWAFRSAST
jgi:transposase